MTELERKLSAVRACMEAESLSAIRLRGTDWFSWMTCGGSNVVLLTTDVGVAEVLVTRADAWIVTDAIEARRISEEEAPVGLEVRAFPWATPTDRERFIHQAGGGAVASDRPAADERPLPASLWAERSSLGPEELDRYRALGRDAAAAMTEVLCAARPEWTGFDLAGGGAEALWGRGIHPALTLVGGERRLPIHRHATASAEKLKDRAMLVFCARRHGLFANLTRFVYFRPPRKSELELSEQVARVEAAALDASRPGAALRDVYARIAESYRAVGHPGAEADHHQGGTCGYLSRDVVARPDVELRLVERNAVAWNPSLAGAKIEDTAVVFSDAPPEVLTVDPRWPTVPVDGRQRPALLVR